MKSLNDHYEFGFVVQNSGPLQGLQARIFHKVELWSPSNQVGHCQEECWTVPTTGFLILVLKSWNPGYSSWSSWCLKSAVLSYPFSNLHFSQVYSYARMLLPTPWVTCKIIFPRIARNCFLATWNCRLRQTFPPHRCVKVRFNLITLDPEENKSRMSSTCSLERAEMF